MTFVIIFILAVLWAGYILSWLRARNEERGSNSISSFSNHLSVLERTSPVKHGFSVATVEPANLRSERTGARTPPGFTPVRRRSVVRMSITDARRRRRDVIFGLGFAALTTFVLGFVVGPKLFIVNAVVDLLLVGYVIALARAQRLAAEREAKVRYLPGGGSLDSRPQLLLHRSAN